MQAPRGVVGPIETDRAPALADVDTPNRMPSCLVDAIPPAPPGGRALDLGCGHRQHRALLEAAGYEWVGIDIGRDPQLRADAHHLPLRDDSVDLVLTMAVLEHVEDPAAVAAEIARVLRPGGTALGSVAFIEPLHSQSHYHHSEHGLYTTLSRGGLSVERIAPLTVTDYTSRWGWHALQSLGRMGLFPAAPHWLVAALTAPLWVLHRLWWSVGSLVDGRASETYRRRKLAGAFAFIATV